MIATHDHDLTTLAAETSRVGNAYFSERLQENRMVFEYRLRAGPARSRNALRVLAMEGFPEDLVARAMERARPHEHP